MLYKRSFFNHHVNELTKFIRNLKKISDVLSILLHLYIKFQDQNIVSIHFYEKYFLQG
jgi:hypothetical protein